MKININNSDTKGIPKSKKTAVGNSSSIVKDFSTGNLNLEELVDREDEYLSYTDPRHQTKKPLSSKRPKYSEKDDLIII